MLQKCLLLFPLELQRINDPTQLGEITTRTKDILKTWFPDNIKGSMFYNDAALIIMEIVNNTIEHTGLPAGVDGTSFSPHFLKRRAPA